MPDPFSRKIAGISSIGHSADQWNGFVDASRAANDRRLPSFRNGPFPFGNSQTLMRVRNDSGSDVPRYGVLCANDIVHSPYEYEPEKFIDVPTLAGFTPSTSNPTNQDHWGAVCIATQPIADGSFGTVVVDGVAIVRLHFRQPKHRYAGVKHNDVTQIESRGHGPIRILWTLFDEENEEDQLAIVRLNNADDRQILIGRTVGAIDVDTIGSVTIWNIDATQAKGDEASTSWTVQAYNRFGDVDANMWVALASIGYGDYENEYDLISARCVPMGTTTTTTAPPTTTTTSPPTTTTTTSAPTTTTTAEPTTTTTAAPTTTTTSTTTTAGPTTTSTTTTGVSCTSTPCTWTWNGVAWVKTIDCTVGCLCPNPVGSGLEVGQETNTPCVGV